MLETTDAEFGIRGAILNSLRILNYNNWGHTKVYMLKVSLASTTWLKCCLVMVTKKLKKQIKPSFFHPDVIILFMLENSDIKTTANPKNHSHNMNTRTTVFCKKVPFWNKHFFIVHKNSQLSYYYNDFWRNNNFSVTIVFVGNFIPNFCFL